MLGINEENQYKLTSPMLCDVVSVNELTRQYYAGVAHIQLVLCKTVESSLLEWFQSSK